VNIDIFFGEQGAPRFAELAQTGGFSHPDPIVGLIAGAAVFFGVNKGLDQMNRMMV